MTTVAIELNDAGILTEGDPRLQIEASPGYALLEGKDLQLGAEAKTRSRQKPRWVDNRFWDQLDANPMPKPFPRHLSRADVAHSHLSQIWKQISQAVADGTHPAVLLAVPGSFSVDQLGLILGIARAGEIPVAGLVDAAVAATSTQPVGARALHLDATLHRMIWTELIHDGELIRRRVEVLETGGLASVWDAWAKSIAKLLIRQTRFDPFHHGRAEQTLYDRLPQWMEELASSGRTVITLESEGKQHSVELTSETVDTVSGGVAEAAVELGRSLAGTGEPATLMISERAAGIPGLVSRLSALNATNLIELEGRAAVSGALKHRDQIEAPGGDLPFVVRLPVDSQAGSLPDPATPPPLKAIPVGRAATPSHLLFEATAHLITSEPIWLGSATSVEGRGLDLGGPMPGLSRRHCAVRRMGNGVVVEDHSSFGTYLNGRRIEGQAEVTVGDRLRVGSPGVELLLIAVAEDDV